MHNEKSTKAGHAPRRKALLTLMAIALGAVVVAFLTTRRKAPEPSVSEPSVKAVRPPAEAPAAGAPHASERKAARPAAAETTPQEAPSEAENERPDEEERLVNAFDDLTDRWMEPSEKGVTLNDISAFVATFSRLPDARREECLQRALNLIPDENVMLLAGILMDRSLPKECAERVFNDILNRSEDVKNPILRQVYRDKSHPCHTDAAWILDVTGEKPD